MTTPEELTLIADIQKAAERYRIDPASILAGRDALLGRRTAAMAAAVITRPNDWAYCEALTDVLFGRQLTSASLSPMELRAIELLLALDRNYGRVTKLFQMLCNNPLIEEVVAVLLQRWGKVDELFRTVFKYGGCLIANDQVTLLGCVLLPHVIAHPLEVMAVAAQSNLAYWTGLCFTKVLLAAQPPLLDLVDEFVTLDRPYAGGCAALLLPVDPARFLKHTLRLTEPGVTVNEHARVDALTALVAHDPQKYADRAAAAARESAPAKTMLYVQRASLELAFNSDPVKYLPLLVDSIKQPNDELTKCAVKLAMHAPADAVAPALREVLNRDDITLALIALETLLVLGGIDDAMLALVHTSKKVRDQAVVWLVAHPAEAASKVAEVLNHRTAAVRQSAVAVFAGIGDAPSRALLQARLEKEAAQAVKQAIADALGNPVQSVQGAGAPQDLVGIMAAIEADGRKLGARAEKVPLPWVTEQAPLPPLRWMDGSAVSSLHVNTLLYQQSRSNDFAFAPTVARAVGVIDRSATEAFAEALYRGWVGHGANNKEVWCLVFVAAWGGDAMVPVLRHQIDDWVKHARGALASRVVWALPLIGTDLALSTLNDIANRVKHKQVKAAATQAFANAAQMLGITQESLQDRVAPRLGLDERGERTFDYGTRQFIVRLAPDLSLSVRDATGKAIKLQSVPAPNKSDDAPKAEQAQKDWKELRAALKQVVKGQSARLEQALVSRRTWEVEAWKAAILRHPVLRPVAVPLVWEARVDGAAPLLFRPLEDGSLTDAHDDPVTLPANAQVRLAHPVMLDDATRAEWLQHLTDYDLKPPFAQLARTVAVVADPAARVWTGCEGYVIEALAFLGRYDKAGWQKGSVQDGGGYHTVWKEFPADGVEAVLTFSGMSVGYMDAPPVVLEKLEFARAGSLKRGSYVYDDLKDNDARVIKLGDAGAVVYSESVGDVQSFMAAGSYDPEWRKRI